MSFQEDRVSADMDRILSSDPVLAAVAELFAEPARPSPRSPATTRRPTRRPACPRAARPRPAKRVLLGALALVALAATLTGAVHVFGAVVTAGLGITAAVAITTWLVGKPAGTSPDQRGEISSPNDDLAFPRSRRLSRPPR